MSLTEFTHARSEHEARAVRLAALKKLPHKGPYQAYNGLLNSIVADIGYPISHLTAINTGHLSTHNANALGDCWTTPDGSAITLYKPGLDRGPAGIFDIAAHEMAHVVSPFKDRTALYGSQERQEEAQDYAIAIANQTIRTGKAIDGYHRYLLNQLNRGEISEALFYEETLAILHQQRLTNPAHLAQVQESQRRELERKGRLDEFVMIFDATQESAVGIDAIILTLNPELGNDIKALNTYVHNLRRKYLLPHTYNVFASGSSVSKIAA